MKKSVKTVLAYVHVTGYFPRKIHLPTWAEAREMTDFNGRRYDVKPEFLDSLKNHPFLLGREYLKTRGFDYVHHEQYSRTSHTIRFGSDKPGINEAYIARGGGGWIWTKHPTLPGRATESLDGKF